MADRISKLSDLILTSSASFESKRRFLRFRTNHANPIRALFGDPHVSVYEDLDPAIVVGTLVWERAAVRDETPEEMSVESGLTRQRAIVPMNWGQPGEQRVLDNLRLISAPTEVAN